VFAVAYVILPFSDTRGSLPGAEPAATNADGLAAGTDIHLLADENSRVGAPRRVSGPRTLY
jgi:hypothetical protein